MFKLYHYPLSTCSQKVRLVLEHKGLAFETQHIDLLAGDQHDPEYVKLNPNHVVPTLVHDGRVLLESTLINEYLNDAFPAPAMLPDSAAERHAARLWNKRLDDKVHPATGVLTFSIGPRTILMNQPEEVREANINAIPDPVRRAARRSVLEHGVKAPEFAGALSVMLGFFDLVEAALVEAEWLSGAEFGLADAAVLPYVLRLDHLAMTPVLEARPNLLAWYRKVQALPAYEPAVIAWSPQPTLDLFAANGTAVWKDVEPLTR